MQRPAYLHHVRPVSSWLLLLFAMLVIGIGTGLRDPWPADEPRFALNALEMIETGQYLIPHRGGEPYPDKPPIFMWAQAAAIAVTGSVSLGFLLPSLLAALGSFWLVVDLSRRLYSERTAWLAGATLIGLFQFMLQAKSAQIDMLLTFWTTLGSYGLLRHALLGPARHWWYIGCAAMGLGILTKGVGFLPLLMVPVWYWLARRGRATPFRWQELVTGLLIILATMLLWLIPMIIYTSLSNDPALLAYRDNILLRQTIERYADSWDHLKPWYYYVAAVLPWAWLPLVLGFPWLVPGWWRRLRRLDAKVSLPLLGVVLIVVFFSLSPGKRGVYMLPTAPLLVLAAAPMLAGLLCKPRFQRLAAGVLAVLGLICLTAGLAGYLGLPALARLAARYDVSPWAWWTLLGLGAAGLFAWLRPRQGMVALFLWLTVVWWGLWSTLGYLEMNGTRSPRDLMQTVVTITGDEAWLGLVDFDEEFLLQARQPSVHFGYHTSNDQELQRAFAWVQGKPGQRWLLVSRSLQDHLGCVDSDKIRALGHQNSEHWLLIPGTAAESCRGDPQAAPLYIAPTTLKD